MRFIFEGLSDHKDTLAERLLEQKVVITMFSFIFVCYSLSSIPFTQPHTCIAFTLFYILLRHIGFKLPAGLLVICSLLYNVFPIGKK